MRGRSVLLFAFVCAALSFGCSTGPGETPAEAAGEQTSAEPAPNAPAPYATDVVRSAGPETDERGIVVPLRDERLVTPVEGPVTCTSPSACTGNLHR